MLPLLAAASAALTVLPLLSSPVTPLSARVAPARAWPVQPSIVVGSFDPPAVRWLPGHRGVDLAASPAQTVVAAAAGVITYASNLANRGVVVVDHGPVRTTYEPVAASVDVGTWVSAGDVIGTVEPGSDHCGEVTCLHWGLRRGDTYLDPRLLLGFRPVLKRT